MPPPIFIYSAFHNKRPPLGVPGGDGREISGGVQGGVGDFYEKSVFGPGTLPQAPFFVKKKGFWSWYVAAGAFFSEKISFWYWNVAAGAFFC